MQVISVVRNFDMYNRLIQSNKHYGNNVEFVAFDNNKENKNISIWYNHFLKNYDYSKDDWFIFCHEDWELKDDLSSKLLNLDKNCLYGPIGMTLGKCYKRSIMSGCIIQSDKEGNSSFILGKRSNFEENVGTFDCQCLIVHSSLIKKYNLKFDENLSFDLYVEDFCINSQEKYNICSKILPFECQHYSHGKITNRFFENLKYLRKKYKNTNKIYCSTVKGYAISGPSSLLVYHSYLLLRKIFRFFYQKKLTKHNKTVIKLCKIPFYINS